jgi:subtilase family serine protease
MTPAIGGNPLYRLASNPHPTGSTIFGCQDPSFGFPCYTPVQIRAAYNIQPLLDTGITGKRRTIAIIDAYQSPTIRDDLALFDGTFGLNDPILNILAPDGLTPFDSNDGIQVGWSGEISIDVEWAHAVAPDATIDLVLAKSNTDEDLLSATRYAIVHNLGDVITQSFGEPEICARTGTLDNAQFLVRQDAVFKLAKERNITVLAASGDTGAAFGTCDGSSLFLAIATPASDPYVTGVGGTNLTADLSSGTYQSERAWDDGAGKSGGGFSVIYKRPGYQEHVPGIGSARGVPDVAFNAGVFDGNVIAWIGQFFIAGGTSVSAPEWAGIIALADQKAGQRLGFLNPALYSIAKSDGFAKSFHDITSGDNIIDGVGGYICSPGWDPVTGWGTPDVENLVALLIQRIVEDNQG